MSYIKTLRNLLNDALNKDNYHNFDSFTYKNATRQYVPQLLNRMIWVDGRESSEEAFSEQIAIDFFKRTCFRENSPLENFSLIFADPGMGKTTLLLNIFHQCATGVNNKSRNYKVSLFSLANPSALEMVRELENKHETVLMLDGFDEDIQGHQNFKKRFREIYDLSKDFAKVIMTSRPQLTSFDESGTFIDFILGDGEEKEGMKLSGLFIAPMSLEGIAQYLVKAYSHKDRYKRRKATEFIKQTELLAGSPLLLSYIDELIEINDPYSSANDLYKTLIESWLNKDNLVFNSSEKQWGTADEEGAFYREIAREIHSIQRNKSETSLSEVDFRQIVQKYGLDLEYFESNHNAIIRNIAETGEYQFIHRVVWEYFLALEADLNLDFLIQKPFIGREKAQEFFRERRLEKSLIEVKTGNKIIAHSTMKGERFFMDKFLVRVGEYQKFCEYRGVDMPKAPSWGWDDHAPIVNISLNEALEYCQWLSKITGLNYRLPTISEWEYAALGGHKAEGEQKYAGGESLAQLGWFAKNSGRQTQPVGQLEPNQLGIYDLCGNVWEWCQPEADWEYGIIKGGSWINDQKACMISNQGKLPANTSRNMIGFRVVVS